MNTTRRPTLIVLVFSLCSLCPPCPLWSSSALAHEGHDHATAKVSTEMAAAAKSFFDSLTDEQKAKARYDFKHEERLNWHFVPRKRNGLPLSEMTEKQRELAKALLATAMSQKGNEKALGIINLEPILKEIERARPGPTRDSGLYFWTLFGDPNSKEAWAWRVEGHHLALNFTIAGGHGVAAAPSFMGTNPAEVRDGAHKGLRILAEEEDMGRALIKSLSDEQRKKAVIAEKAYPDIITGNQREAKLKAVEGLPVSEMTEQQRTALMDLIGVYANRFRTELAADDMKRIAAAGPEKIHFAWAGPLEKNQGHYYRIHGPTFLIEYDNTQNNANHVHSVWRDLQNDFGGDALKKHYQEHAHK